MIKVRPIYLVLLVQGAGRQVPKSDKEVQLSLKLLDLPPSPPDRAVIR